MITPIDGGQVEVNVSPVSTTNQLYSPQFVKVNRLESRPTEWVPGGRPIYKRLPAVSQTYQVSFEADGEIGYVFIPYGQGNYGVNSLEVVSSNNFKEIIIQGGTIIWKEGRSTVKPVILNIEDIDILSGKYTLGYELIFDDSESSFQYEVTDYPLYGQPLNITAGSDSVIGWRYPPSNIFVPDSDYIWRNSDNFFPDYSQPSDCTLSWESELPSALSNIKVKLPGDVVVPSDVTASLYYSDSGVLPVTTSVVQYENGQGYFSLSTGNVSFQKLWKIVWTNSDGSPYLPLSVDSIEVSGTVTLTSKPSGPVPKSTLVMYPLNTVPPDIVLCELATVEINTQYEVTDILDTRYISHRDYVPVADWLTKPWDDNLIRLYESVQEYPKLWMDPPSSMTFEYETLTASGITVS